MGGAERSIGSIGCGRQLSASQGKKEEGKEESQGKGGAQADSQPSRGVDGYTITKTQLRKYPKDTHTRCGSIQYSGSVLAQYWTKFQDQTSTENNCSPSDEIPKLKCSI